ncbi:hypothetical protein [Herbiconiux sp. UC225_62]|uniref:hypothetical protein n=1 Tax=Herbiconiux sp. UC225_62 TaxID=3350168 RepID=UPI0036D26FD2
MKNPAGRLWLFLNDSTNNGVGPNTAILNSWSEYFGLEAHPTPEFLEAVAKVVALPQAIRSVVEGLIAPPVPKEYLVDELPKAENALTLAVNFSETIGNFRGRYDAGTLKSLEFCSHVLNSSVPRFIEVDKDTLSQLHDLLEDLMNLIRNDESLTADVKRILFEHTSAMSRAVDLYKISGVDAVVTEFDAFRGHLARAPEVVAAAKRSQGIWKKLEEVSAKVTVILVLLHAPFAVAGDLDTFKSSLVIEAPVTIQAPEPAHGTPEAV